MYLLSPDLDIRMYFLYRVGIIHDAACGIHLYVNVPIIYPAYHCLYNISFTGYRENPGIGLYPVVG